MIIMKHNCLTRRKKGKKLLRYLIFIFSVTYLERVFYNICGFIGPSLQIFKDLIKKASKFSGLIAFLSKKKKKCIIYSFH